MPPMDDAVQRLLQQALQARRENRPFDAQRDLTEAVAIARSSGTRAELGRALTGLGQIERDLGNAGLALDLYQEAAGIYRTEGDALRLAHTIRHVADIHRHEKHPSLAEPCYHEALDIYRKHSDTPPLDLANAIRGLALLKCESGATPEAKSLWEEARELYAAANVEAGVRESTRRLAELVTGEPYH